MRSRCILWLIAALIGTSTPGSAQNSVPTEQSPIEKRVDQIVQQIVSPDQPGCTIAAFKNGQLAFAKGYGLANLDHDIPNSPETVFRIASVSKHVTAACMLLLEDDDLVDLDADIREYLPKLPDYGHKITIRHLLHHTSGLREYSYLMMMCDIDDSDNWEKEDALDMIFRQRGLDFIPGEKYSYCNSGYFLCSIICERVTGKSLREFADLKIFKPLKMLHTHFHDESTEVVKKRANGYSPDEAGKYHLDETGLDQVGDGGIYTTIADFGIWTSALIQDTWKPGLLKRMLSKFTLNGLPSQPGEELTYRFGIDESSYRSYRTLSHGGAWVGYRSQMWILPDEGWVFLCFANRSDFNPRRVLRQVSEVIAADLFEDATEMTRENWRGRNRVEENAPEYRSNENPNDFIGLYYSEELQVTWLLQNRSGELTMVNWGDDYPLKLTKDDRLVGKPAWLKLKIHRDSEKNVRNLEFGTGVPTGIMFKRYSEN
ncbi:hypothetical protein CBD41_07490 [bacterium TMED181]|nr:hypothetical protein [Planctomycetota bacterium]OUW43202.1 MAG: hypothetical protein CBD41_07490 [bacterium TMED181]